MKNFIRSLAFFFTIAMLAACGGGGGGAPALLAAPQAAYTAATEQPQQFYFNEQQASALRFSRKTQVVIPAATKQATLITTAEPGEVIAIGNFTPAVGTSYSVGVVSRTGQEGVSYTYTLQSSNIVYPDVGDATVDVYVFSTVGSGAPASVTKTVNAQDKDKSNAYVRFAPDAANVYAYAVQSIRQRVVTPLQSNTSVFNDMVFIDKSTGIVALTNTLTKYQNFNFQPGSEVWTMPKGYSVLEFNVTGL